MVGEHESRRLGRYPPGQPDASGDMRRHGGPYGGQPSTLRRFLGGSPISVLVRLLFLSVLVGAVMAMLGLTPGALLFRAYDAALALYELSLETFHGFGRWILAGAVIVVPLWLISRFLAMGR